MLPTELETLEARTDAELVMLVWALLKLANSELREDAAEPVAVARAELIESPREPTEERAEFCWEVMDWIAEEPPLRAELMIDEPEAIALEMPLETADAAELAELTEEVSWAEATEAKAATKTVE